MTESSIMLPESTGFIWDITLFMPKDTVKNNGDSGGKQIITCTQQLHDVSITMYHTYYKMMDQP